MGKTQGYAAAQAKLGKHPHTRGKDFLKDSLVSQSFRMLSMSTS